MNNIKIVFNKEMRRVFRDPKMIFSLFLLPVIILIGIYSLIGYLAKAEASDQEQHKSVISVQNAPADLESALSDFFGSAQVTWLDSQADITAAKQQIYDGTSDLLVIFPENFLQQVEDYEAGSSIPEVLTFYNPSQNYSTSARENFVAQMTSVYEKNLLKQRFGDLNALTAFTIDQNNPGSVIQDEQKASGKLLATMLPYMITLLLFAGTMSLGTDTIAGEKERGTMASMLVTPAKRSEIVLGKLLSLTVLSLLSALVYLVALIVALPQAMSFGEEMAFSITGSQIAMLAAVILSLAFLYVALVAVVAVFAKSVKEASAYVTPIYLLVIVAGIFTMISPGSGVKDTVYYLIPVYNCSVAMGEVFTMDLTITHFLLTFFSTLAYGGILTAVIAKAFGSEKVMFNA
ncbi:ABC transporter permease [Cuneatibacter caecimuris]|uniref:Sodium transport system permease protein n=1 Tax=Cuneatibacter caecimuris TaxID=1796618 RepID=A0A4Q7PLA7_9FIRM|nr:ABC transporter permease [Cuneatibacter caecimuris]RZT01127.1 sodium transport system permease protein [Cuneatibacter caecimuris]